MHLPDPDFPPILTGHPVKAPANAFATACRRAAAHELGAADIVWARSTERAELALILEPDVPRRQCLQIKPLFFNAVADSLGALMPPKTAVHLRWPDSILLNGAIAGELQFALAPSGPDEVPDWLVVGAGIQVMSPHIDWEPGDAVHLTSVRDEGGVELDRTQILRSLSAHMLSWLQVWQDDGFRAASDHFIARVEGYEDEANFTIAGETQRARVLGISDDMQLLVRIADGKTLALDDRVSEAPAGVGAAR
jgi:biotin-(acetyl-CoA carboxylase) ligase